MGPTDWRSTAEALQLDRGAGTLEHPGGTLHAHVARVADLLGSWGAGAELQAAGLCHACYGTDGFAATLLGLDERDLLTATIGEEAEALVYLYAACDRGQAYPRWKSSGQLLFFDRFTGWSGPIADDAARALIELTAANELDLVRVDPAAAAAWAPRFWRVLGTGAVDG